MKRPDQGEVHLKMELAGKSQPCLLDTGSSANLVPRDIAAQVPDLHVRPTNKKIWAANDTEILVDGEATVPFTMEGRQFNTECLISPDVEEIMLGIEWVKTHKCLWDFSGSQVYIGGQPAVTWNQRRKQMCRRLYANADVVVLARQKSEIPARATLLSVGGPTGEAVVEHRQVQPGVYLGRSLLPPVHRDLKICIVNTTTEPAVVKAGEWLGNLDHVEVLDDVTTTSTSSSLSTDLVDTLAKNLPEDLTSEQRQEVTNVLSRYTDIFSTGPYDMGCTSLVEHTIDVGNSRPIRQALRRHSIAHLEEIDRQVAEMVRHDIVELAASPWAANVVMVRKENGSLRLYVDYRSLNRVTYGDSYPLPHIDTCLGSMNGASWFSTLDLRSGYHNIPIRESDREKTAFITRRGCFRYKVLPFGLTTAPSVFQRLRDLVLCGLTYVSCLVYIDDIIVFSNTFETHVDRLTEVFERLKKAGLKLHVTKCNLSETSLVSGSFHKSSRCGGPG